MEAVDLDAPEWAGDINNVASVLKMWLRELPDPLLTNTLHQGFIDAASACGRFPIEPASGKTDWLRDLWCYRNRH